MRSPVVPWQPVSNLPEPARRRDLVPAVSPSLVRAAVSPGAVALAAAGAAVGALVFHAWVVALLLAFAGWASGTAAAALARRRQLEAARPRPAALDPWSVPEPWRPLLQQVAAAQQRFDRVVADWPPGPMKERLQDLQPQVWSDVAALGAMARRGAAMTGWTGARPAEGRPSAESLSEEMRRIAAERAAGGADPGGDLDRREEAVASQLRALRRSEQAAGELLDRMRSAAARLDTTVTDLLALGGETGATETVLGSLEQLSDEVAALRAAVAETTGTPPEPTTP